MSDAFKENIDYPAEYSYKMVGDDTKKFRDSVKAVFMMKKVKDMSERPSSKGNYVSITVTVEVGSYEELRSFYEMISRIEGLRYHL
ncbi:HP0495 family protein [Limisalsivibrio acetivorans]|uniref:HP0495 family protein n=1 Tax=Limisalsivibrio acetivorans TaxID=1304888 RepID=UPI0003B46381|nr:DUF493 domain-containing protein [Limisalsivibrio acetivorans]